MKFEKLVLEKYGNYENREVVFRSDAHLHVIVGPNEAGKTSALSAIGDLLFGFPHTTTYDFLHTAQALRLGAVLRLQDGAHLGFRRRKGRSNTIVDASDKPIGDDLLDMVLRNFDRATFEKDYGLTAERLRKGGNELLQAGGDLAQSLAAGSTGLSALNRLRTTLQAEADELFTPRKTASKAFYVAADAYTEQTKALREAIVSADAVKQAEIACTEFTAQLTALEEEHKEISRDIARLKRVKQTRPKLAQISAAEDALAAMSDLPHATADDIERWGKALRDEAAAVEKIADNERSKNATADALAALTGDPAIIEEAATIGVLRERLGAADKARADLPKRETELRAVELHLDQAARDLGCSDREALLAAMPKPPVLARVQAIVRKRREADIRRQGLDENLKKACRRHADLAQQDENRGHVVDPEAFVAELERFASVPTEAERLRQLSADFDQALQDLSARATRLQPAAPPLEELVRLPLPNSADVDAMRRAREDRLRQKQNMTERQKEAAAGIAALERKLENLARGGAVATRADLTAARTARDAAFAALRGRLDADPAEHAAVLATLSEANLRLDMVTDSLLGDADRAAAKLTSEQELEKARDEEQRLHESLAQLNQAGKIALDDWRGLWSASGIEAAAPDTMRDWLSKVQDIRERHDKLSLERASVAALQGRLAELKPALLDLLERLGARNAKSLPIEDIYKDARRALSVLQKRWDERREQATLLKRAATDIAEHEAAIADLDAQLKAQAQQWAADMADISRNASAEADEADSALGIWQRADGNRKEREDLRHRIGTMHGDIESFEAGVADFCARIAPDLAAADPRAALNELEARLQKSRQDAADRQRLERELAARSKELADLQAARKAALEQVAKALAALSLDKAEALRPALDRLVDRIDLEAELARHRAELVPLAEGLSVDALRAEHAAVDPDGIDGEIDRLEQRSQQLLKETNEAAIAARDAQRGLDALLKGRNAATIAQQKQAAAAELLDISRRWLARAAAARLAAQAIERHRQSAQDPVIKRTSELFAYATAGAFAGIGDRFGDNDERVFKAVRASGEDVEISGLSDGSRDQLFLALRLALLEQRRGEALPFIGDDLLTSFDEERTGQAIEMLSEFGQARQVILFTHHRHVGEIARQRLGGRLDLIEL